MPPFYRILEVVLYVLLNFVPYMILAMIPFRSRLRFSKPVTVCLIIAAITVQIGRCILDAFSNISNEFLSIASTVLCAVFYFTVIKANLGKQIFTLLILTNIANFVNMAAKCLEGRWFSMTIAHETYRYSYSICMIIVQLLTILPLYFYFCGYYAHGIDKKTNHTAWRYLWLIPATFYIMWYHHVYTDAYSTIEIALQPGHILFLLFINLGALLIYHTVIEMINARDKSIALENQNHQLSLQNLQYQSLQDRIEEARKTKHDIRHHIIVADQYLQNKEYDKLQDYLHEYKKSLPDDSRIIFCRHTTINALLLYFAQQAKNNAIDFDVVTADIPNDIRVQNTDLTVILGNLLENALEACMHVNDRPRSIVIKAKADTESFFFCIENTYSENTICDDKGEYLSTKREGKKRGIGLSSVQSIVKQHNGILESKENNGIFSVSVFLNAI